jgi:hypothetical protein
MQHRTTVRLVASDPVLYRSAAYTLAAAHFRIVGPDPLERTRSDLVVRHWAEEGGDTRQPSVPELTLDLSLISGDALVEVVERVVGPAADSGVGRFR